MYPYEIQIVQALKPADYEKHHKFAQKMLTRLAGDHQYLNRFFFMDEATFHLSGHVHRHNVRIWWQDNPHVIREHERDSPKLNVWACMFCDEIVGPFFFEVEENTVRQTNFLHMLENFAYPLLRTRQLGVIFQLDGAPAHWGLNVLAFLNARFRERWISRDGPPSSPVIHVHHLDSFVGIHEEWRVFFTPATSFHHLKDRIFNN